MCIKTRYQSKLYYFRQNMQFIIIIIGLKGEKYCEITKKGSGFYITDLNSVEGTWVSVRTPKKLTEGTEFKLGNAAFRIVGMDKTNKKLKLLQDGEKIIETTAVSCRIGESEENELVLKNSEGIASFHAVIDFSADLPILHTLVEDRRYLFIVIVMRIGL
eukprot:TRINITY_DN88227_c0_g1_i1.p5 TRINITY_DN88227_c0_g1~~TRINITY_DN88227_c0_g1_i1.p5  ORF type:complete len:160 (+),score=7.87 TRINITY_DN88227_c0_g1_i1:1310-1789(+)